MEKMQREGVLGSQLTSEAFLARLIAFQTVTETANIDLIAWVERLLRGWGAEVELVPHIQDERICLWARIGPPALDGIVLSAHSDVVPVEGQDWHSDPFVLTEQGEQLYGRGTSDMKGFLACMLIAARRASISGTLKRPLHLAISCDEEVGCVGVRSLLRFMAERQIRAAGCIVGEPTRMAVVARHKGKVSGTVICHGVAAHSANPSKGCNAIGVAAHMFGAFENIQNEMKSTMMGDGFEVPHSTVHVGLIKGGTALNIVPDRCEMAFEMRLLPNERAVKWLARLQEEATVIEQKMQGARVEIVVTNEYPGLSLLDDCSFLDVMSSLARSEVPGAIDFGTEAGLFSEELGLPTIICGPGSITRAHKADEYITRAELQACDDFLLQVVESLRG